MQDGGQEGRSNDVDEEEPFAAAIGLGEIMEASSKSLSGVLQSARRFVIPEYQRPYCWSREEVQQLWNDLTEAYKEFQEKGRPTEGEEYFLGPIVVASGKDKETGATVADVVDGQQRLTTIHALLWCVLQRLGSDDSDPVVELRNELSRHLLTPGRKTTLHVAREDQTNFLAIKEGRALDESRELGWAGSFFREQLAGFDIKGDLVGFTHYLLNQTTFVLVQTDGYASAWELFIALNGKGKPLAPSDLIKAYACGTSVDSSAMAQIWQDKVLPLGDATSALLDITRVATGDLGSDAKLFRMFERAWSREQLDPVFLGLGADIYRQYWYEAYDRIPGLEKGKRALRGLRALNRTDHTPIIIAYGAKYGMSKVFRAELLRAFEAYQYWMAIRGKHGRARNFTNLANAIYADSLAEAESLDRIVELLRQLVPPRDEVREAVRKSAYRGRVMLFTVRSYEEGMRGDVEVDDVWYEHLTPQTATDYWYDKAGTRDAAAYNHIVNNIGNVMCLDPKTNIKGSNDPWDKKRELYRKEVPNWLIADVARNNDEWTPADIEERAETIADWAVGTRWDFEDAVSKVKTPA